MSDEEIRNISDPTLPNAGRIYDYILGGNNNFPVDRKIADDLLKRLPVIKKITKMVRWFLGEIVERAFKMGFMQFLDFASGLPSIDHIHIRIPENVKNKVKIIYSDIDPVTVQYGRKILKDEIKGEYPIVKFLECDCRKPEILLDSDIVKNLFDKKQKIAIGLSGILYFLTDEQIDYITNVLYEWAPKESIIYFCDFDNEKIKANADIQKIFEYYKAINQPIFFRTQGKLEHLFKPWKIKEPGFQLLEKWLELELGVSDEVEEKIGGFWYGGILEK